MNKILSLGNKKSLTEAIGFYLIITLPTLFLIAILGGILGAVFGEKILPFVFVLGMVVAGLVPGIMSFSVMTKKNLKDPMHVILALASILLGAALGIFVGTLPVLYLATLAPAKGKKK